MYQDIVNPFFSSMLFYTLKVQMIKQLFITRTDQIEDTCLLSYLLYHPWINLFNYEPPVRISCPMQLSHPHPHLPVLQVLMETTLDQDRKERSTTSIQLTTQGACTSVAWSDQKVNIKTEPMPNVNNNHVSGLYIERNGLKD